MPLTINQSPLQCPTLTKQTKKTHEKNKYSITQNKTVLVLQH